MYEVRDVVVAGILWLAAALVVVGPQRARAGPRVPGGLGAATSGAFARSGARTLSSWGCPSRACFYIALKSVHGWIESTLVVAGTLAVFGYSLPNEAALWRPFVAALGGFAIAVVFVVGRNSPDELQM